MRHLGLSLLSAEGLAWQGERRAAPSRPAVPSADRTMYPSAEWPSISRTEDLFPAAWFSVEASGDAGDESLLHPLERAMVARAVPKRRAEFAAGRGCARRALARLAVAPVVLLSDAHGCPQWPPGTLGSISHTAGCAIAVAALRGPVGAVGVDVERIDAQAAEAIAAQCCGQRERRALNALSAAARATHACAVFSAKEAVYKCVYAATGERLTCADACVSLDFAAGLFTAVLRRAVGAQRRTRLVGRVGCNELHVFSGLYWLNDL